jgi:hypothetical protein
LERSAVATKGKGQKTGRVNVWMVYEARELGEKMRGVSGSEVPD